MVADRNGRHPPDPGADGRQARRLPPARELAGAALGLSSVLFTYVFGFAGADPSFPLFAFVFLVALGIDYNIFLMTRVREETMNAGTRVQTSRLR